jgi:hypothetical protein
MIEVNAKLCIDRVRIHYERFEDETVIINVESGFYYSLSESGSEVLRLIDNGYTPEMVIIGLFGNSEEANLHTPQIIQFIEDLIREGILIHSDNQVVNHQSTNIPDPVYSSSEVFRPPLLEKYDEVRDLLLIDPIHMVDQSKGWPKT